MSDVSRTKAAGLAADEMIKALQQPATPEASTQEQQVTDSAQENTPANEQTQQAAPAAEAEVKTEPAPVSLPEDSTWEARYKVLQGKYNAEVPVLHKRNRDLEGALQQAYQEIDALQKQLTAAPAKKETTQSNDKPSTDGTDWASVFSEKELADYPPEFFTVVDRLARFRAEQMVKAEIAPLKQTTEQLSRHTAESAQETFHRELLGYIPDLNTLNSDPNFIAYLNNTDPRTGTTLHQLLLAAYQQRDTARVKFFFDEYRQLMTPAAKPAAQAAPVQSMTDQVAPGRNRAPAPPVDDGIKVYTPAEVSKFYADKRAGKYKGREAEADRIERDIFRQKQ